MSDAVRTVARLAIVLLVATIAAAAGIALFWWLPGTLTELLGILLAVAVALVGLRLGSNLAQQLLADYDVAEVAVEGPITRDSGGSPLPSTPNAATADEIVAQIERADEDDAVEALLVHCNTPGGEVVASEDVRTAAAEFDGPTIAYTSDICASGGMWIASGCDELWAREGSIVGSIGVRFSQTRFDEFADRYGISYERIVSGEYKDAVGAPLKEMEPDEREYVQGLSDAWYDQFVERVAESWDLSEAAVRDTEARVYLGTDGAELGIVDVLGDRDDAEEHLADVLDRPEVTVESFEPDRSLPERLQGSAAALAFSFGAGLASVVTGDGPELR